MTALLDADQWRGRRVLLTGHTGFKGAWAALCLARAGAQVHGLALAPEVPSLFALAGVAADLQHRVVDVRDRAAVAEAVADCRPEVVLHFAAQAIVRRGVREPVGTIATNVLGTVHLLDALREAPDAQAVLVVTSDKVYDNRENGRAFVEHDRLSAHDPYAASKAAAELMTEAYARTYFASGGTRIATARAGNVIGGGDFAENRLVPDILRAIEENAPLNLRRPESTRPWQHVLDCLGGYFRYSEAMLRKQEIPRSLNFGPSGPSIPVRGVAEAMLAGLGRSQAWHPDLSPGPLEADRLAIDSSAARRVLRWSERLTSREAIEWTADWYRAYRRGEIMRAVTLAQIECFEALASDRQAQTARTSGSS